MAGIVDRGAPRVHQVLFLSTDNHCRGRYAELLFNHAANLGSIGWRADSRGLVLDMMHRTPISRHVLRRLDRLGIERPAPIRWPVEVTVRDLQAADRIIALDLTEHRPLIRCHHLEWDPVVEYWEIGDLDVVSSTEAFEAVEDEIARLMRALAVAA